MLNRAVGLEVFFLVCELAFHVVQALLWMIVAYLAFDYMVMLAVTWVIYATFGHLRIDAFKESLSFGVVFSEFSQP